MPNTPLTDSEWRSAVARLGAPSKYDRSDAQGLVLHGARIEAHLLLRAPFDEKVEVVEEVAEDITIKLSQNAEARQRVVRADRPRSYVRKMVANRITDKRQDFSDRAADAKSLLDEVLRRGREERAGAEWKGEDGGGGRGEWGGGISEGIPRHPRSMKKAASASVAERG